MFNGPDMRSIIAQVRDNPNLIEQYKYLSTSEWLVLCLGIGDLTKLPASFPTISDAWRRIDGYQRTIVTDVWMEC